jgi:hypothetical protein
VKETLRVRRWHRVTQRPSKLPDSMPAFGPIHHCQVLTGRTQPQNHSRNPCRSMSSLSVSTSPPSTSNARELRGMMPWMALKGTPLGRKPVLILSCVWMSKRSALKAELEPLFPPMETVLYYTYLRRLIPGIAFSPSHAPPDGLLDFAL